MLATLPGRHTQQIQEQWGDIARAPEACQCQCCDNIGLITPVPALRDYATGLVRGGCLVSVGSPQVASVMTGTRPGRVPDHPGAGQISLTLTVSHHKTAREQISEFQSKYLLLLLLNDPPQRADFSCSHPVSVIGFLCPNCFVSCICNRRRDIKWDLRQTNPNISHLLLLSWGFSNWQIFSNQPRRGLAAI